MYSELIERLAPKPVFNLKWYKDEDLYSDGDVEDVMIQLIAENEPENYVEAIRQNMNWPVYYHLTHLRKNILNWYPFEKESSVLEIGCGLGAITNMLCEKCHDVTAVELSKRRATATLLRCREKENLEIIVGNLNDIEFEKKFDYITLIGVLEYQGTYTDTDDPYMDFLREIKKLLKPDGKLLIAIENKYGLKYWCGAREDHTGIPFDGMNQYSLTNKKVKTFSKKELEILVKDSGFKHSFFYYPMPDYKLPTVLYSQDMLPTNGRLHNVAPYYIPDRNTLIADEMEIYKDVIENGVFEFFANSFLVECSDNDHLGRVRFGVFSTERKRECQVATVIKDEGVVEKFPINEAEAAEHIQNIVSNMKALKESGRNVLPLVMQEGKLVSEYVQEESLEDRALNACRRKDKSEVYRILDKVYEEILASSYHIEAEKNIFFIAGIDKLSKGSSEKYGPILHTGYIDMILRNAFYINGQVQWFDQEWVLQCVPARYILYRTVITWYQDFSWADQVIPMVEVAQKYNLVSAWREYEQMDVLFYDMVIDRIHMAESQRYRLVDKNACVINIQKILGIGQ